jgi:hypothetical protein
MCIKHAESLQYLLAIPPLGYIDSVRDLDTFGLEVESYRTITNITHFKGLLKKVFCGED